MLDKWKETKNKVKLEDTKEIFDVLLECQRYFFKGDKSEYKKYILNNLNDILERIGLSPIKEILSGPEYLNTLLIKHEDDTISILEIMHSDSQCSNRATDQCKTIEELLLYKLKIKESCGINPRVFLIAEKIYSKTVCMLLEMELPVILIEVQNDRVFIPYMHHKD